jgi:hypothetical protein
MPVWFREPLHKTGCHSERSLRSEASRKKIMKINDAEFFAALGMTQLAFSEISTLGCLAAAAVSISPVPPNGKSETS